MPQAQPDLRRLNRALRMISRCNQALVRAVSESALLQEVCRIVVEEAGYLMAWVGFANENEAQVVNPVAQAGFDSGRGPTGLAMHEGKPRVMRSISSDPAFAPWREEALDRGYLSSAALPLASEGRVLGTLSIYSVEAEAFDEAEVSLLKELADDLAFGICTLRTREARQLADVELQLFRQLINQTSDIILVLEPALGRILDCNDTACLALGYTRQELLRLCMPDINPDLTVSEWPEYVQSIRCVGSKTLEGRRRRQDGTIFSVEISVRCTMLYEREYLISVVRDITERQRAQEALRESEERFRALFENSPVPILEEDFTAVKSLLKGLDKKGLEMEVYLRQHPEVVQECAALVRITDVNRAAIVMHEASCKEELLQGLVQTFTPESYEAFFRGLIGLYQGENDLRLDGIIRTLTGKTRHVNVFLSRVPGFQLQPSTILVSLVDITSLKKIEGRLKDANANLRLLLQTMPDLVWLKDPAGIFLLCNPPVERLLGVKEEQLVGKTGYDFYPADKADLLRQKDLEAAAAGQPYRYEQWVHSVADGRDVLLETIKVPVHTPEGNLVGVLGIARDISSVRKAEETLRKLSRAVEQSPASIVITDLLGNIEYVNPKFSEVTGYMPVEVVGQNPRFLKSGETTDTDYQHMWQALSAGKEWNCEFHNRKKNGELFWELASISPIFDNEGRITHYLAVKENITERKRLEEEFRQAQKMEAFGQLAGGVAHDFNNILTVIQGNSALLQMGMLTPEEQAEALEQIAEGADRASRLTRQLLTFSRRQTVQRKELDLNLVVLNMTRMLQRLIGEHISLVAHYAPGGAAVQADEGMMEQVLMNLAVNARDAMPAGGQLRIQTELVVVAENPQERPGTYVRLSVNDTGEGIAAEDLPHIFEPFFTTKDVGRGTGLGLATVFGIVQQHQGWLTVDSQLGGGTTFRVYLPTLDRGASSADEHRPALLERGGSETILLVEDEPSLRRMVCRILERHGYRVYAAESGQAALSIWSEHSQQISLLLTDMVMPGNLGGRELGKRLQTENPALRVIYSTGYTDDMLGEAAGLRGTPNFLEKPYEPAQVLRKVRACLDA